MLLEVTKFVVIYYGVNRKHKVDGCGGIYVCS